METTANKKTGVFSLGYVINKETYIEDLRKCVDDAEQVVVKSDIDQAIENGVEYLNGAGYASFPNGKPVDRSTAKYIRFAVPFQKDGKQVIGWFKREKNTFTGVDWGTIDDFEKMRIIENRFNLGSMYFDNFWDGSNFLEDIAKSTIPESWKYKNKQSGINHPILKSYLENILNRLIKESQDGHLGKIVLSKDKKYALFNTNLLDKYFHEVIVVGEAEYSEEGELFIKNPSRSTSRIKLRKMGFAEDANALPPRFFDDVNEVIFQTSWEIDNDFDTFTHIIEERRDRFPEEYHDMSTEELATKFDNAIDFAVALAQRNYKFIVPMYRPQEDKIQLLMPIYLKGTYSDRPDFALILTPNKELRMYEPETILPLDAAYQNARLIAKPEESWLNPDEI